MNDLNIYRTILVTNLPIKIYEKLALPTIRDNTWKVIQLFTRSAQMQLGYFHYPINIQSVTITFKIIWIRIIM